MSRLILMVCVFASGCLAAPNVLLIVADDMRPDALANPEIATPALDALAARSIVFTNAYCMGSYSGAVCGPSRAMIM
ncbi:MAG: sulfatase-like hydrolase/transferase, partial [Phycisphaerales bacterium]|nr:sulfatase-like hydrolase/transferase [Phycisphaerales bacterium]